MYKPGLELFLQPGQTPAEGRFGQTKGARRAQDAAVFDDLEKQPQIIQIE